MNMYIFNSEYFQRATLVMIILIINRLFCFQKQSVTNIKPAKLQGIISGDIIYTYIELHITLNTRNFPYSFSEVFNQIDCFKCN